MAISGEPNPLLPTSFVIIFIFGRLQFVLVIFIFGRLHLWSSSFLVVFFFRRLHFWSSSFLVVFILGRLYLWSSSFLVTHFGRGRLHFGWGFLYFRWGHLSFLLRWSSSFSFIYLRTLLLWETCRSDITMSIQPGLDLAWTWLWQFCSYM